MVHAVKLTWKLGCGLLDERQAGKCHALVEAGYLVGSLLFTVGTVYFFPLEGLEDFTLGCRYYEVGSMLFWVLTMYTELDRYHARKNNTGDRKVTQRELLEEFLYCLGSFVFLVGTFMFDPPFVAAFTRWLKVAKSDVLNVAAVLFMVGSFMFSFGSYVNALSIFEAPKMFRRHLLTVTTSYMCGGLLFIAGTMGYVEAFEPNDNLKWCSTWLYMIGCVFYVTGSFMSLVSIVATHQVHWERVQVQEQRKKRRLARMLGKAGGLLPRALKKAAGRRRHRREDGPSADDDATPSTQDIDCDVGIDEQAVAAEISDALEGGLEAEDEDALSRRLGAMLGPEAGRQLAEAIRGVDEMEQEEENVFGAFWRSMTGAPLPPMAAEAGEGSLGAGAYQAETSDDASPPVAAATSSQGPRERDDLGLLHSRH
eukprot:TRINITY_DN1448_c0_g1_i1.p1 TRINITY_DN1448_c0_g1~~TRINITY_DN1448_c0_g1_i1.p1  ORF type:complete len:425 (+),score=85.46 TRINITY_DN1448_c0_g1_i1:54-1328(+)